VHDLLCRRKALPLHQLVKPKANESVRNRIFVKLIENELKENELLIVRHVLGMSSIILGPDTLEESFPFFCYDWRDKNKVTTILGIHVSLLGGVSLLLVAKANVYWWILRYLDISFWMYSKTRLLDHYFCINTLTIIVWSFRVRHHQRVRRVRSILVGTSMLHPGLFKVRTFIGPRWIH
jgi:hypothetical protein